MKNHIRAAIGILTIVVATLAILLWIGFNTMGIEDRYGDLQDVYYKAENQDVIIDSNKRFGFIYKDSGRIFVEESDCMKDLNSWISTSKFSVYRLDFGETLSDQPTYDYVIAFIEEQGIKPIISK